MKVTIIKEIHDLSTYKVKSLIGNLRAHEVDMLVEKVGSDADIKKKGLTFKALLVNQESDNEDLNEELLSLDNNEVPKSKAQEGNSKGKQYSKSKAQEGNVKGNNFRNANSTENSNVCFECK